MACVYPLLALTGVVSRSGKHLPKACLTGVDLQGANLSRAVLSEAQLTGAKLTGANLQGTDLRGAHLDVDEVARRGWLCGAVLGAVDWTGRDLRDSKLEGVSN